jgi:polysaccharide biosynthesis/export protein
MKILKNIFFENYRVMWCTIRNVTFLLLVILLTGCTSQKKIAYFPTVDAKSSESINQAFYKAHEVKICPNDMLTITVSGLDPAAVAPFNLPIVAYSNPGSDQMYSTPVMQSYLVDINGNINFPVIGNLKLGGLTKSQAIKYLKDELAPYLKNVIVTIQFINYKITVLGEVAKPGQYSISNERVTILDALGLAGDMTIFGKRENVLITRENNGKLEFARLNLNSEESLKSPYYYLQQNDVIYVEPNSDKIISSENVNTSLYLSSISTLLSTITVIFAVTKK